MKLTDNVVRSFKVAKVFRENSDRINACDFSPNGETLITSSDDDSIVIYDCQEGKPKRTVYSKKYGVSNILYTHTTTTVIHSSTKVDDTIRYLSLHDNKFLRYFSGHTKRVVTLCMSPIDDTFLSGSLDKTMRIWDLRSPNCQGLLHVSGRPTAGFDPEGLIFAAGVDSEIIRLYDLRSFDKGPFATFHLPSFESGTDLTNIKFSNDGKTILIPTTSGAIHLLDAFQGNLLHSFTGHVQEKGSVLKASFSPDSQYVFTGSNDGRVHAYATDSGKKTAILDANHPGPISTVSFNPKFMMFASACSNMAFWLPNLDELEGSP